MKQCRFIINIVFRSFVDLRFCILAVPKKIGIILAFVTHFPAKLVLWQYNMHIAVGHGC